MSDEPFRLDLNQPPPGWRWARTYRDGVWHDSTTHVVSEHDHADLDNTYRIPLREAHEIYRCEAAPAVREALEARGVLHSKDG
jgi:hypothetical protein